MHPMHQPAVRFPGCPKLPNMGIQKFVLITHRHAKEGYKLIYLETIFFSFLSFSIQQDIHSLFCGILFYYSSAALQVCTCIYAHLLPSFPLRKQQNFRTKKLQLQTSTRQNHKQKTMWIIPSFGIRKQGISSSKTAFHRELTCQLGSYLQ